MLKNTYSVILIYLFLTILSISFGFISPDSWIYILLAHSLDFNSSCMLPNKASPFPCGYPFLISLLDTSKTIYSYFVSSKFVNLISMLPSIFLAYKVKKLSFYILIFINPIMFKLFQFTWSEFLMINMLFSIIFIFEGVDKDLLRNNFLTAGAIIIFTIIGLSSRYTFAPVIFIYFISAAFFYKKSSVFYLFKIFSFVGILYIFYLINQYLETGYLFNTYRPDNTLPLKLLFFDYLLSLPFILFYSLSTIIFFHFIFYKTKTDHEHLDLIYSLILFSILVLIFKFVIRLNLEFDGFNSRTIGPFFVILVTSVYVLLWKPKIEFNSIKLVLISLPLIFFTHGFFYVKEFRDIEIFISAKEVIHKQFSNLSSHNYVFFNFNNLRHGISGTLDVHKLNPKNIIISLPPFEKRETILSLHEKIKTIDYDCTFSFAGIDSLNELKNLLNSSIHNFLPVTEIFNHDDIQVFDQELANFLIKIYNSQNFSCSQLKNE